jgi:uracil-DNA glycosylase
VPNQERDGRAWLARGGHKGHRTLSPMSPNRPRPRAETRGRPSSLSARRRELARLSVQITQCRLCPRLVAWREKVGKEKRASFADEVYWARPVPGFGDPRARVCVVGLAPAAHGGNRTGRVFTGDRSGDWLFGSLWRTGFANQPDSVSANDGLALVGAYVLATVRCAPPDNRPSPDERDTCRPYLRRELELLSDVEVLVALGGFAYQVLATDLGLRPRPAFAHGVEVRAPDGRVIVCCYHPSQQNTFTGRLTEPMLDAVFVRARELAGFERPGPCRARTDLDARTQGA